MYLVIVYCQVTLLYVFNDCQVTTYYVHLLEGVNCYLVQNYCVWWKYFYGLVKQLTNMHKHTYSRLYRQGFDLSVKKAYYRRKTPLVESGTRTRVLADSMTIAASALNHCTTWSCCWVCYSLKDIIQQILCDNYLFLIRISEAKSKQSQSLYLLIIQYDWLIILIFFTRWSLQ